MIAYNHIVNHWKDKVISQTLLGYRINELSQTYPLTCPPYHILYGVMKLTLEET